MIVSYSYKYNPIKQGLENANVSLVPQVLIPFNNITKKGWCDYHKSWELITITPDNNMFFSCGLRLPSNIGLNKSWNKNQYEFIIDTDNFLIRVNERWHWIDVYEREVFTTQKVFSKIIDFNNGIMSHPKDYDLKDIPPDVNQKIMHIILNLCKRKFGIDLHAENANIKDFIKYPGCPEFNHIEKKVDNVKSFNFRADLNLFKDFCNLVQLKETKRLRKDFHKEPETILLHAFCQYIGFTNTDAIKTLVSDNEMYRILIKDERLRFSIKNRTVYLDLANNHTYGAQNVLNGLRLWVQNARTDKSEAVIVKRMIKFFKETEPNVIFDAIGVYNRNARNLPVAFHERILKEGFTNQMHDQLVLYFAEDNDDNRWGYRSNAEKVTNQEIDYDEDVLKFEDFIDPIPELKIKKDYESIKQNRLMMLKAEKMQADNSNLQEADETFVSDDEENTENEIEPVEDLFEYDKVENEPTPSAADFNLGKKVLARGPEDAFFFALPKDTDELYEISTNMRNCVGYLYRNKVLTKTSIIAVLIHNNKMKACMEIKQDKKTYHYKIIQALGPGNAAINRKYFTAIEEWKKRHDIEGEIKYKL